MPLPAPDDRTDASKIARQAYNVVSDLGTGVNIRKNDNLLQLKAIALGIPLGVLVGLLVASSDRAMGAVVGGSSGCWRVCSAAEYT